MANRFASQWMPPRLRQLSNRLIGASTRYRGPFDSWEQALLSTHGYEAKDVIERVSCATSKVLNSSANYEQDGVAFHSDPPASLVLSGLILAAARNNGRLVVLDFGGGLASHYLRWRRYLKHLNKVTWCVVEQKNFVARGRLLFPSHERVRFESDLDVAAALNPNVVLASSVIHYLPNPLPTLASLAKSRPDVFIVDRTPLSNAATEIILTQHVPRQLGSASYPLWLLPEEKVLSAFVDGYDLVSRHPAVDAPIRGRGYSGKHTGFTWVAKPVSPTMEF